MAMASTTELSPAAAFWDKAARRYAKSKIADEDAYQKTLLRVTEHLGPNDTVLELGSGTGSTALLLADNVKSYLSTDFSSGMMEIANEKLSALASDGKDPAGLAFLEADAFDPRLETEDGYDAILGFNFLHLVEEPEALLNRAYDLMKPGGLLITKTVCLKQKAWLFGPLIKVMQLFGKAPFVSMLSPEMVNDLMTRSGFEVVETGLYPAPRSHFIVARKV